MGVSKVLYLNDDQLLKTTAAFIKWKKTHDNNKDDLNTFVKECFLEGLSILSAQ